MAQGLVSSVLISYRKSTERLEVKYKNGVNRAKNGMNLRDIMSNAECRMSNKSHLLDTLHSAFDTPISVLFQLQQFLFYKIHQLSDVAF